MSIVSVGAAVGGSITSSRSTLPTGARCSISAPRYRGLHPARIFFMPESVHWLARKQPSGALQKINRTLARLGHSAVAALPVISADVRKRSVEDIFRGSFLPLTILVTLAYFLHITTFYFIVKWVPKDRRRHGAGPLAGRLRAELDERGRRARRHHRWVPRAEVQR